MNLAGRWTEAAQVVEIEPTQVTTDTVDQKVYITATQDKFNLLYNLITRENMSKVIVFANRRDITRRLNDRLHKKGLNVSLISGDVPQNQRMKTLERFRAGDLQVLIATDSTRVSEVSALWVTIALRCLRSTKKNPDHDEMREMGLLMVQEGVRMAKTR